MRRRGFLVALLGAPLAAKLLPPAPLAWVDDESFGVVVMPRYVCTLKNLHDDGTEASRIERTVRDLGRYIDEAYTVRYGDRVPSAFWGLNSHTLVRRE